MTFVAVASVSDTGEPATPVTPRFRLARASAGVTVRDKAVAEAPSADGVMVYTEVDAAAGATPANAVEL